MLSLASTKTEKSANETINESEEGDNFSVSTGKRTQKQTMADVEDNGFNLRAAHSSSEEDAKHPEYWVDFYKTSYEHNFINLVRCQFTHLERYSEPFLDMLSECLVMDVSQRQSPISLLSHPIFKQLNRRQS